MFKGGPVKIIKLITKCAASALLVFASVALADDEALLEKVVRGEPRAPVSVTTNKAGNILFDFGLHQFGWLEVDVASTGRYEFVWGELLDRNGSVETNAFYTVKEGNIRCACTLGIFDRTGSTRIPYRPGEDGTEMNAKMIGRFGLVMPFRWLEVVESPFPVTAENIRQVPIYYPYDMKEESFVCDLPELERIHDFCKHTIRATTYTGKFIDGDRERLPYEGDSYITLLSTYAMTSDATLAHAMVDYLASHTTWPTEWKQFFIRMVYEDWMRTGHSELIEKHYELMKDVKSWRHLRREDGLLVTPGQKMVPSPDGGKHRDIVDWGRGYRDGFVFKPVNAVVNALHYRNLRELAEMARAIGKTADAAMFDKEADRTYAAYQKVFFSPATGHYTDGEGTDHETVQANAMALACGVVPNDRIYSVADFITFKGFSCGTYMAQFVLEALYAAGRDDIAFELMTSSAHRGWLAMMAKGATVTMEFWDLTWSEAERVPDMNHAWSTAPLNMISRRILGVTPLEPGFAVASVRPQPGPLNRLSGTVPTVKGGIRIEMTKNGTVWQIGLESPVPCDFEFGDVRRRFPSGSHRFKATLDRDSEVRWPLVTREMKPWVYNWWMASAVDEAGIEHQCRELEEKGFGGFHVIPIYGAKGYEKWYRTLLSDEWIDVWNLAARRAREHDLGIDLTMGSGWCFGGPWVTPELGASSGMKVKRAGPGGQGLMIDPFSAAAMTNHVAQFERWFGKNGTAECPRAFYHDSYEYYGAKPKHGDDPHDAIVACFRVWTDWCRSNGYLTRNEAHGSPVNWLDLYALADIPETEMFGKECRDILISKFASSAAHVKGTKLVSAEACTWIDEHFQERPVEIKRLLDFLFLAGVNHLFYHGCCYSPVEAVWPGWCFYASCQMNPRNPIWREMAALNGYVTRCQSIFQTWSADNDLAIMWNPRNDGEQMTVHDTKWFYNHPIGSLAKRLSAEGYCFDYVSPQMVRTMELSRYAEIIDPEKGDSPVKARKMPFTEPTGLLATRWRKDGNTAYFVVNTGNVARVIRASRSFVVLEPMDGSRRTAKSVCLEGGHSTFVVGADFNVTAGERENSAASFPIAGAWKVSGICGGPKIPAERNLDKLVGWESWDDAFSGTMRYRTTFDGPAITGEGILSLGDVREIARVRLNGFNLGVRFMPPYNFRIPDGVLKSAGNELEVEVTNLGANRIRWNDLNSVNWKYFTDANIVDYGYKPFDASKWPPLPSGMLGPVVVKTVSPVL